MSGEGSRAESSSSTTNRTAPTAFQKALSLLARRDHSERELRTKLKERYTQDEIDHAIDRLVLEAWLKPPEVLAQQLITAARRRGRGPVWIRQRLHQLGLPTGAVVAPDDESDPDELTPLLALIAKHRETWARATQRQEQRRQASRFGRSSGPNWWPRAQRFLLGRGFTSDQIRKALAALPR